MGNNVNAIRICLQRIQLIANYLQHVVIIGQLPEVTNTEGDKTSLDRR